MQKDEELALVAKMASDATLNGYKKEILPVLTQEFLTTQQAAEFLGLSKQFLEISRVNGGNSGPPYIKLAQAVRYSKEALRIWMEKHTRNHTSEGGCNE